MKNKKQWNGMAGLREKRKTKIKILAGVILMIFTFMSVSTFASTKTTDQKYQAGAGSLSAGLLGLGVMQRETSSGDGGEKAELLKEIKDLIGKAGEGNVKKEELESLAKKLEGVELKLSDITSDQLKALFKEFPDVCARLKAMEEKPGRSKQNKGLREYIEENSEVLKTIKSRAKGGEKSDFKHLSVVIEKGTQGASDIGSRDYLGTIEPGIERKPVRRTTILDLFRRKPVGTEYLHFWEENVVTRDAKFVIACATSTHNTKKTWQKRTVELAKIRDIVDICIDMLDDYAFVESEIRQLVEESIMLKADYELLLGASALATDMLSIDSISSEFNPANPLADYSTSFQAPTIGDLTAAMKAQIYTFGQENKWEADTVVMNYNDMIKYLHAKDANNNYLFPNFVYGATDVVNGMRIVTSPIVSANTLYVFDSTKGSILDRKMLTIGSYFENRDNAEHELVTFVGVERLQFHVRNINRDAFMKTSDIEAALSAITKV